MGFRYRYRDAMKCLWVIAALLPLHAWGECTVDASRIGTALSPMALAARNALFMKACTDAGGTLIDATDPALAGHLSAPTGLQVLNRHFYPDEAQQRGLQGGVLIALIVEADGSVHDVRVLEGSGHTLLDDAAVRTFANGRFKAPAQLDGRPIRCLVYEQMAFRMKR